MLDINNLWTALCHLGFSRSTPRSRADRDVVLFGLNREDKADTSIISSLHSSITPRWFCYNINKFGFYYLQMAGKNVQIC
jgi:hypothetical protein